MSIFSNCLLDREVYVVSLAHITSVEHTGYGTSVVFYVQPITNLLSITINWQWLSCQGIEQHLSSFRWVNT